MSNARNLSKFKPSSSGLVETADIADDAVTTAKVDPAQTDITSVGTLTGLTVGSANPQLFLNATVDGGEGSINFKDDEGNVDGKIAYRTDYAGQTDNFLTFNTGGTEKVRIDTDANVSIRNANTTGPALSIGTTSTSVADGGFIGGIMFDAGTSNTACARMQALSNGTSEGGADFSFECRDSGASFTEKMRLHGTGELTVPTQPAFSAYIGSGGHSFEVGDTTPTTIVFNTEHFDNTNSHASGIFTAPVAGKYFFNSTISFYGTDTLRMHDFAWAWYKDDVAYITQEIGNYIQESGSSEFNTISISTVISLNANQNIRTKMYSFGSPYITGKINIPTGTRSGWSGFLIG